MSTLITQRLLLENVIAENRIDRIRIIDKGDPVIGGQPTDGDDSHIVSSESARDLACTLLYTLNENIDRNKEINTLKKWVDIANPVGMVADSFDSKPYNDYWLNLNGDLFGKPDYPMLYDYYLALGYLPNSQNLMALLDARALMRRPQNKGRFANVEEIGLGKYQADATQRMTGALNDLYSAPIHGSSGVFSEVSVVDGDISNGTTPKPTIKRVYHIFDNARSVRAALEDRVKAIGVTALQHIGFDFEKELLNAI